MGKDRYWSGNTKSSTSKKSNENNRNMSNKNTTTTPPGCINAFFQMFDFHRFRFRLNHHQSSTNVTHHSSLLISQDKPNLPKGLEAPRNTLKSLEEIIVAPSHKKQENLNIPIGIKILTKRDHKRTNSNDYTSLDSPGTKTPSLVARLMGLDLLPDPEETKSPLHTKTITRHRNSVDGSITWSRSSPETPTISSARKSDAGIYQQQQDHQHRHRLSLQTNKPNTIENKETKFPYLKSKEFKTQEEVSKSPREFAKQIVKEVKERVTERRVFGSDITNTIKNKKKKHNVPQPHEVEEKPRSSTEKCSKKSCDEKEIRLCPKKIDKFVLVENRRNVANVDKKCKKMSLSTNPVINKTVTSQLLPHRTKLHQNKVEEVQVRKQELPKISVTQKKVTSTVEYRYITRVLICSGIDKNTSFLDFDKCFFHSCFFNPTIFNHLENYFTNGQKLDGELKHRCNRKLLFDLVNEIVNDLSKTKRCRFSRGLVDELCLKVQSYPRADCQVLQDIDKLISTDLERTGRTEYKEEKELMVVEMGTWILDQLLMETVSDVFEFS